MPVEQILIHAGPDKTGSTTVQRFCKNYPERLEARGIVYPLAGDELNHRWLTHRFLTAKSLLPALMTSSEAGRLGTQRDVLDAIESACAREGADTLLLSHEGLHTLSRDDLGALKRYLERFSERIGLLYYVRNPYDYAISATSQRALTGRDPLSPDVPLLDHKAILSQYVQVFGRERMRVRPYMPCVLGDFLAQLGIMLAGEAWKELPRVRENTGLSSTGVWASWHLQRILVDEGHPCPDFRAQFASKLRAIPGPPLSLTQEQVEVIQENTASSTAYLREAFDLDLDEAAPSIRDLPEPAGALDLARGLYKEYAEMPEAGENRAGLSAHDCRSRE